MGAYKSCSRSIFSYQSSYDSDLSANKSGIDSAAPDYPQKGDIKSASSVSSNPSVVATLIYGNKSKDVPLIGAITIAIWSSCR